MEGYIYSLLFLCKILSSLGCKIIIYRVRKDWYYLQNHWFSYVFWCFTTVFTTHRALDLGIIVLYPINNPSKGQWEQVKGIVKETWGDLTDDEITQLEGNRQKLSGKIQERYGRAEDVVEKEIDDWSTRHDYRF